MNKISSKDYKKGDKLTYKGKCNHYQGIVVNVTSLSLSILFTIRNVNTVIHFPHDQFMISRWCRNRQS